MWNNLGTRKVELIFIKAFITLCTFTYLQLDQERQVGDFSVVLTASSMTFFIGSRRAKRKIQKQNEPSSGSIHIWRQMFFGHFWPTYPKIWRHMWMLPNQITSQMWIGWNDSFLRYFIHGQFNFFFWQWFLISNWSRKCGDRYIFPHKIPSIRWIKIYDYFFWCHEQVIR